MSVVTAAVIPPAMASDSGTGGEAGVRAFVVTSITLASPGDADRSPATAQGGAEVFRKSLPSDEQELYASADKKYALDELMAKRLGFRRLLLVPRGQWPQAKIPPGFDKAAPLTPERVLQIAAYNGFPRGRGRLGWRGTELVYDSCTDPKDFPLLAKDDPIYSGSVASGINLDGKIGLEDFVGLDGAKGIDNQLWRAVGGNKSFRDEGDPKNAKESFLSGEAPTLIEIRGVDDPRNDPAVTVNIYAAAKAVARDGRGHVLAGDTFVPTPDPKLRATVSGSIKDGVLTTEPFDFAVQFKEQIIDASKTFRSARLRMLLKEDGSVDGTVNGYEDVASFYNYIENRSQRSANAHGYSCPAIYNAIHRLADGFRDPRTGRFTAISSSYNFFGVHAFVARLNQSDAIEVKQ